MEVDPTPATEKMLELLAIMILAFISMALGLTIGLVIYVVWKSNYLRDLIRFLLTSVQHGNEGIPEPSTPVPMDIHEGSPDDSDDDTIVVVTGPRGTWLLSQVSGPREQLPELDQVQQQ